MSSHSIGERLLETRAAFDSVAPDYDGPRGNNALIQDMRGEMWRKRRGHGIGDPDFVQPDRPMSAIGG